MKQVKSLLVLSVLAGGLIAASADSTVEGFTGTLTITNLTPALTVIDGVSNTLPSFTLSGVKVAQENISTDIDGAGKLEGAGWVRVEYLGAPVVLYTTNIVISTNIPPITNVVVTPLVTNFPAKAYSDYVVDITGKVSTKNSNPTVQATYKGQGYSASTVTNYATAGQRYSKTAGSSKMDLKFTGNGTTLVLVNVTNLAGITPHYFAVGTVKGNIKPGITAINDGKNLKIQGDSRMEVDVYSSTTTGVDVVIAGTKVNAVGGELVGSGSIGKNDTYKLNLKGVGSMRGSNLKINGTTGNGLVIIGGGTTNVLAAGTAELTGKIMGQKIESTGNTILQ